MNLRKKIENPLLLFLANTLLEWYIIKCCHQFLPKHRLGTSSCQHWYLNHFLKAPNSQDRKKNMNGRKILQKMAQFRQAFKHMKGPTEVCFNYLPESVSKLNERNWSLHPTRISHQKTESYTHRLILFLN